MPSDGKSSHDLWPGELKTLSKRKCCALTLYMGAAINRLISYDEKDRVSTGTCEICPPFKMAAVTKNRNFFNCPFLL
jgi:hypothetical protein